MSPNASNLSLIDCSVLANVSRKLLQQISFCNTRRKPISGVSHLTGHRSLRALLLKGYRFRRFGAIERRERNIAKCLITQFALQLYFFKHGNTLSKTNSTKFVFSDLCSLFHKYISHDLTSTSKSI